MKNIALPIVPSPIDTRDILLESMSTAVSNDLPDVFDMRPDLGSPRNQGSDGTCAAFTAACIKEHHERHNIGAGEYMSPQFIYDNRANQSTQGMNSRDVMKILNKIGIIPESEFPYHSNMELTEEHFAMASIYIITGYASIHTIDTLKQSLYDNGPALIAVPVYNYGKHMWKPEANQHMIGGHAMTVVGWNTDGFIIRNSWGDKWELSGYTIFPYNHWGMQWEVWTTIDADNDEIAAAIRDRKNTNTTKVSLIERFINWIVDIFT